MFCIYYTSFERGVQYQHFEWQYAAVNPEGTKILLALFPLPKK